MTITNNPVNAKHCYLCVIAGQKSKNKAEGHDNIQFKM